MKKSNIIWIVVGVILLIVIMSFVGSYNRFVTLEQNVDKSWSEVENQYQRQADLIPNLVSIVSSSVSSETKFMKDIVSARNNWQNAQGEMERDKAGSEMQSQINTFVNAVAESYPVFLSSVQYIALTDEVSGAQNRITVARGRYIENINDYNIGIRKFPGNIVAGMMGLSKKNYYRASEGSLNTPVLGEGVLP